MRMRFRRITDRRIFVVLAVGFSLVFALLLGGGLVGIRSLNTIQANAAALVREHRTSSFLIAQIQLHLANLNAAIHRISRDPKALQEDLLLEQVDRAEVDIARIAAAGRGSPESKLWGELDAASRDFSAEVRRVLAMDYSTRVATRELMDNHERLISIAARLFNASYWRSVRAQTQIDQTSRRLIVQTASILGGCSVAAMLFTILTLAWTRRLIHQLEQQSVKIGRVSFHLLQDQESAARRFSHELHDELGQSLTAVKAALTPLQKLPELRQRIEDCMSLVDESIQNVRQMSQLLHPRILDDFGLETALRWLGENFSRRHGIALEFQSAWNGRLEPEAEMHLFRIAQEALTNVSRHSGATRVEMRLDQARKHVVLTISDNGRGFSDVETQKGGIGLVAMRARAENLGGNLEIYSQPGKGCTITARIPAGKVEA